MDKEWEHVVVLGAAGKMGSGIALLLLQEMASMPGSMLTLLDTNMSGFPGLKTYLRMHLLRFAERNINRLREYYKDREDLVDNGDMIEAYIQEGLDRVRLVTSIEECREARMVFEAVLEDVDVKADLFSKVNQVAAPDAVYFSNTSSIPIHVLEERSHIKGRLIGFHFYNPPAVQKLLEIIIPDGADKKAAELALKVGKRLDKIVVHSHDIAGFIGNGHFIREVAEACSSVEKLQNTLSLPEAICVVNTITQDYLIRPMGLFQLMDYVGIDVVQHIAKVMTTYLKGLTFHTSLVDAMVSAGVKGGQNGDGSQKNGFFFYEKGIPVKVYELENRRYIPYVVPDEMKVFPEGHETWKALSKDKEKKEKLMKYFIHLLNDQSMPSRLAVSFLTNSRSIAHGLVEHGVARSVHDVDTVLKHGFFHLYGADDPWKEAGGQNEQVP